MSPLLEVRNLIAHYGDFQALFGIDLYINPGETLAIIGSNGAGKSTLLRSIVGSIRNQTDSIVFNGESIGDTPPFSIVSKGVALVPEGRQLFPSLSVEENLKMGTLSKRAGPWNLQRIYELFPVLSERRYQNSTELSGGQQQMVAIGRALMSNPELLLCDEISLGLAPIVIKNIYQALPAICAGGITVLIVEQDIRQALAVSDRVYCLKKGQVSLEGRPAELTHSQITEAYFGV